METLRCEKLWKTFEGTYALADSTMEFSSNGVTAIMGPNGAGKTTLLNVLTGFIRPDSGRCYLNSQDITGLPPYRIARLGMARTFQNLRLIQEVTVLENVMLARPNQRGERLFPALLRFGVADDESRNLEAAMRLLHLARLEEKASTNAGELSYGQQKILTLACCLATEARVLLLDEPVAGVDPIMTAEILRLLGRLRDMGKLVIFAEHDVAAVRQAADLVIVMDEGKVIAEGPPAEVLGRREIIEAYLA